MTKLIETDEEVEKAKGLMPKGGSKRMLGAVRAHYGNKRGGPVTQREFDRRDRLSSLHFKLRQRLRKSGADPIDAFYAEVEKARGKGLISGGSSRLASRFMRAGQKGIGIKRNAKLDRVMSKIGERNYRGKIPGTNRFRSAERGKYK